MFRKCPLCGEKLVNNKCPFCGYVYREATWSQRTTACEECLAPEIPLTDEPVRDPDHDAACEKRHASVSVKPNKSEFVKTRTINGKPVLAKKSLLILTFVFGWSGIQRFMTGKYITGVIYLLTFGLQGIGWILDIFLVATGHFRDKSGRYIRQ